MPISAVASAGSMALGSTKGAHPTMRLDSFLRSTDPGFQHAEAPTQGDHFIRKMSTYGNVRPSASFISESRVKRPFCSEGTAGMSNLPPPFLDPRGEEKEGTLEVPRPPPPPANNFIKLMENHSLMLPSERYKEHLLIAREQKKWKEDREAMFKYKKRMNILEMCYPGGVIGIDGPMHAETKLWAERRAGLVRQEEHKSSHAEGRAVNLNSHRSTDDATACRNYGSDHGLDRYSDLGIQRKRCDPTLHPWRFMDTHDRLFPTFTPTWDPSRAAVKRSHDVRDKSHNIINGADNSITYNVAMAHGSAPAAMEQTAASS